MKAEIRQHGVLQAHDKDAWDWYNQQKVGAIVDISVCESVSEGTQSMLNTWMMWMGETAKWMSSRGATMPLLIDKEGYCHGEREFRKDDAHDLFTSKYLGVDPDGKRKTWSKTKSPDEIKADMGDKLHAMDCHLEWATEKGLKLTVKKDSEYMKLKADQV